jgi:murein DD-endopeptidase MepM/ murein hydrolase activator NlpD
MFGQRYAYDFVRPAPGDRRFYRSSPLRYLLLGVRLRDCFGWGAPIYAPLEGVVVQAEDGWLERDPVHPARDLAIMVKHAWTARPDTITDFRPVAGNYIILETGAGFAFFAHAQTGSICVAAGDRVEPGQALANVGHSGNSTAPHLHFHLMDHPDPRRAQGIPCCFRDYEVFQDGAWRPVQNGIPSDKDRIRRL